MKSSNFSLTGNVRIAVPLKLSTFLPRFAIFRIINNSKKDNLADAPSRQIAHDEPAVTNDFLRLIEADFNIVFTLDTCSHLGVARRDANGALLPYCSRFSDGSERYVNLPKIILPILKVSQFFISTF